MIIIFVLYANVIFLTLIVFLLIFETENLEGIYVKDLSNTAKLFIQYMFSLVKVLMSQDSYGKHDLEYNKMISFKYTYYITEIFFSSRKNITEI